MTEVGYTDTVTDDTMAPGDLALATVSGGFVHSHIVVRPATNTYDLGDDEDGPRIVKDTHCLVVAVLRVTISGDERDTRPVLVLGPDYIGWLNTWLTKRIAP